MSTKTTLSSHPDHTLRHKERKKERWKERESESKTEGQKESSETTGIEKKALRGVFLGRGQFMQYEEQARKEKCERG